MRGQALEIGAAPGREAARLIPALEGGERDAVTEQIEDERHARTMSARAARCQGLASAAGYIPDLAPLAAAATSFELMSTVIMNPFVPLNSNAFGPSR